MTRVSLMLLAGAAFLAAGAPAFARDTGNRSAADVLFRAGREALGRGDYATACPKFEESLRLDPGVGTTLNLVDCDEHAANLIGALARLEKLDKDKLVKPGDDRIAFITQHTAELQRRIPRLLVTLDRGAPEGTAVTCDGAAVALPNPTLLNPGEHVVVAAASGYETRTYRVTLREGDVANLSVAPTPPPRIRPIGPDRSLGYVTLGVGVAFVAAGAVSGIVAVQKKQDALDHCDASRACDAQGLSSADSFQTFSVLSTISFVLGAVGVGVGTYLIVTGKPRTTRSASIGPISFPQGGGVGAEGAF